MDFVSARPLDIQTLWKEHEVELFHSRERALRGTQIYVFYCSVSLVYDKRTLLRSFVLCCIGFVVFEQ